jgi:hypothetical protein
MEDLRFDSLVKAVAMGASRRRVLKGLLGLGGVSLIGSATLGDGDTHSQAAYLSRAADLAERAMCLSGRRSRKVRAGLLYRRQHRGAEPGTLGVL